jgi:hypothetical protein
MFKPINCKKRTTNCVQTWPDYSTCDVSTEPEVDPPARRAAWACFKRSAISLSIIAELKHA